MTSLYIDKVTNHFNHMPSSGSNDDWKRPCCRQSVLMRSLDNYVDVILGVQHDGDKFDFLTN